MTDLHSGVYANVGQGVKLAYLFSLINNTLILGNISSPILRVNSCNIKCRMMRKNLKNP